MNFESFELFEVAILPIIIGIAQVLKNIGLDTKYIPIVNILLSTILGIILNLDNILKGVVFGLALGLTAGGTYDVVKATKQIVTE